VLGAFYSSTKVPRVPGKALTAPQQPLFAEYKGVRLGMTAQEVRTKLGEPTMKDSRVDYFVFSDTELRRLRMTPNLK